MACDLCDLPTPDPPVTAEAVDGTYCCRGCREVARRLDEVAVHPDTDDSRAGRQGGRDGSGEPLDGSGESLDTAEESLDTTAESIDTGAPDAEGETAFFAVDGMHCATCELFLEATATDHPAVEDAQASYPTGSIRLVFEEGTADPDDLADHLDGTGYGVRPIDEDAPEADGPLVRLLVGGFFGMMTMAWYVLFLYPAYLGLPAEALLLDVHGAAGQYVLANLWVMTTVVLGYTGFPILRGASVSLRARRPNMDLLVALAAGTAYCYSTIAVLLGRVEVYFDIAVVVVLVVTLGEYYKRRLTDRATGALADLTRERVGEARRRSGAGTSTVPVEALDAGDEVVVRTGERVPLDGTVVEGDGTVDTSLVTGESVPERRQPGDDVVGGASVTEGSLVVAVDAAAESTLDRVVRRLWTIQTATPGVQRLADRIALVFVPLVVALAVGATLVHLALGASPVGALLTGLTVLIVSCPCALGLATPLSVASATRDALERGIAVLDESVFERATAVDVVALDKTGTLTTGEMRVRGVVAAEPDVLPDGGSLGSDRPEHLSGADALTGEAAVEPDPTHEEALAFEGAQADPAARELLGRAAALEQFASHPVAATIVDAAGPVDRTVSALSIRPGLGVTGRVDDVPTAVGHPDLLSEAGMVIPDHLASDARTARERGRVPALVGWDGRARGLVVAGDQPREDWETALETLATDHDIVLITGDESGAAEEYADRAAIDDVFAGVPPEGKAAVVERLRSRGTVAMVGDGTNDAPALAAADLGIALSSGTALAAEAADVVVTSPDLDRVGDVFSLTRAARSRIRQNLGWAFLYNALAVPLAALGVLNPLLAAVAMTSSSLLVVANASRSLDGR